MKYQGEELKQLSNHIDEKLKNHFDRALSGCDHTQKVVLSAIIESRIVRDDDGLLSIDDEKLELEKWAEKYE